MSGGGGGGFESGAGGLGGVGGEGACGEVCWDAFCWGGVLGETWGEG